VTQQAHKIYQKKKLTMSGVTEWPKKNWPYYHELFGNLSTEIVNALGYGAMHDIIQQKHNLSTAKIDRINTTALTSLYEQTKHLPMSIHCITYP
jgi:hypothetical protein